HQFDRLLRAVAGLLLVLVPAVRVQVFDLPNGALCPVAAPVGFLALAHGIPARLMPPVVVAAPENEVLLRPDNLRANLEADAVEAACGLARVDARVPNVGHAGGK